MSFLKSWIRLQKEIQYMTLRESVSDVHGSVLINFLMPRLHFYGRLCEL